MTYRPDETLSDPLPVTHTLTLAYTLSVTVAILMTVASVGGLLYPATLYPTDDLRRSFLANDGVNLFIGLPILLGSMWLTWRGKLIGLLFWPGALLYVVYNYIAYLFGAPASLITLGYLALVLLSAFTSFDLVRHTDHNSVQAQLVGAVPARMAGWVLVGFGVVFVLRAIGVLAQASAAQKPLPMSEIGLLIADVVLAAVWIAGGALLLRRRPLGYVSGLGLLFAGSMLFVGLIMVLLLQSRLTHAPLDLGAVIVVFVMGLVCFVPFGLFVRGVLSRSRSA